MNARRARGFSLIEAIIVIVVLSIAAVGLLSLYGQSARTLAMNEQVQTAAQLAQQCGEHILQVRRRGAGFGSVTASVCNGFQTDWNALGFDNPSVTVTAANAHAACPSGASCNLVTATVNKGGSARASVTLLLVN